MTLPYCFELILPMLLLAEISGIFIVLENLFDLGNLVGSPFKGSSTQLCPNYYLNR